MTESYFERISLVFSEAWLEGEINTGELFTLQIQLLHERLRKKTGYSYSDEEIRLAWKSFFAAKYPPEQKCDRGFEDFRRLF